MIYAIYFQKSGTVAVSSEYVGYPFCTYLNVEKVERIEGNVWMVKMENGDIAHIGCDIMEWRE